MNVERVAEDRMMVAAFRAAAKGVDPILLKHVGGDLYAVVAEWDLTEIERAVLEGRI